MILFFLTAVSSLDGHWELMMLHIFLARQLDQKWDIQEGCYNSIRIFYSWCSYSGFRHITYSWQLGAVNAIGGSFTLALAASVTIYMMTKFALPISTTQAIVGAIIGWNFLPETRQIAQLWKK